MNDVTPTPTEPQADNTPAPNNDVWYAGIEDADLKTYAEKKGFKAPHEVLKSYREAEKRLGSSISLPKEGATPDELSDFYKKIGRPDTAEAYSFLSTEGIDADFAGNMAQAMHASGIPDSGAKALMEAYNSYIAKSIEAQQAEIAQAEQQQIESLKKEWGANYEKNETLARNAAYAFGVTGEQVDALQRTLGFDGVMKFFNNIATKISEDKFISGQSAVQGLPQSKAEAEAEYQRLIRDPEIYAKYRAGDPETTKRFYDLQDIRSRN